jgi:ABA DEFICIENT 4-like
VIPALLSLAYAGLVAAYFAGAEGGFSSIAAVRALFASDALLVAGWLHYLAFDLFVGAWQVRTARAEGIPHLLVVPCLVLTFLFGPVGFLAFLGLRAACARRATLALEV